MFRVEPVAYSDDDIALDAERALRAAARQFAGLHPVGPVGEPGKLAAIRRHQLRNEAHHVVTGRTGR